MNHYSDPTASRALGGINREFSRLEKQAKKLCRLLDEGKITMEYFQAAQARFTGIYRHVLTLTKREWDAKKSSGGDPSPDDFVSG